jgi:hypothetical protein
MKKRENSKQDKRHLTASISIQSSDKTKNELSRDEAESPQNGLLVAALRAWELRRRSGN